MVTRLTPSKRREIKAILDEGGARAVILLPLPVRRLVEIAVEKDGPDTVENFRAAVYDVREWAGRED